MSDTAVLVVDMLNSYQHSDAEVLIPNVAEIIDPLADLVERAGKSDDVDVVYVNDNYGDFTAEFSDIVGSGAPHRAGRGQSPGDQGPSQRVLFDSGGLSARPS
jgi:nicotinamidase-related amidase